MDLEKLLSWCDSMISKYEIADEDVLALQELLNDVEESDLYGTEYETEVPEEEV